LVEYFSRAIWWEIIRDQGFTHVDTDQSGTIDR
jgi:hypothetical protein